MAELRSLSQATIVQMVRVFGILNARRQGIVPLVRDMHLELLEAELPFDLVDALAKTNWDFLTVFTYLHSGKASEGWVHNLFYGWLERQMNIALLVLLAQYACAKVDSFPDHLVAVKQAQQELIRRLELDGYTYDNGTLRPTDSSAIDVSTEVDALTEAIRSSELPNRELILHHYQQGENLYATSAWEPAMGEWRKFLEQILRDIAEAGAAKRPDVKKSTGTMKDVLDYLATLGFLDKDERTMYGNTYGILSAGTKPGLKQQDLAHGAMIQALSHGQLLLKKYSAWKKSNYRF